MERDIDAFSFIQWWVCIFIVTFVVLMLFGMAPQRMRELPNQIYAVLINQDREAGGAASANVLTLETKEMPIERPELPTRLMIPGAEIDFGVVHPKTADIPVLDQSLSDGVVHYPASALLGEDGNVLLFGHSSHLRYVRNPAFKALTGIENVAAGDEVLVAGERNEYVYRAESLRLANKNEELVDFSTTDGQRLTISTCNTFGEKDDRYVLTAVFVEKRAVGETVKNI